LVSGYVALTQTKRGRPEPADTADLPTVLRIEREDVADVPPFFRRVLVAFDGDEPPGSVGCDRARLLERRGSSVSLSDRAEVPPHREQAEHPSQTLAQCGLRPIKDPHGAAVAAS